MMNNMEKFTQSYTDLVEVLYDLTEQISKAKDYSQIEQDLVLVDKLSTILKRMSETAPIEQGEVSVQVDNKEGEEE